MPRDRDWVDYANLASNVIQNAQLSSLNDKMRQLSELEATRQLREFEDAAKEEFEATIREAVFFYSEQLRDIEEVVQSKPVEAYFRAKHLKGLYSASPQFNASHFRKYEDKERLADLKRNYDRLIDACASRLQADEIEACDQCVTHALEREDLLRLIAVQEKSEQLTTNKRSPQVRLAAQTSRLQEIEDEQKRQSCPFVLSVSKYMGSASLLGAVVVFLVGVVRPVFLLMFDDKYTKIGVVVAPLVITIGLGIAGLFLIFMYSSSGHSRRKAGLAERRHTIENEVTTLRAEVDRIEQEVRECKPLYARFGQATSDEYRRMLRERDTLLKHMVGSLVKGWLKEDYYNSLGDPPKKIGRWYRRDNDAEVPPVPDELEMLAARVGSENADWIIKAIRSGTPAAEQAAIELYAKLAGTDPAVAGRAIADVKNQLLPRRGRFGTA